MGTLYEYGIEGLLKDLVIEEARHESEASEIQQSISLITSETSNQIVQLFINEYSSWYGDCMAILPEDLKSKFRDHLRHRVIAVLKDL